MNKKIRKIGIITGGGDCSGLNAVINGITKAAVNKYGLEVVGFTRGYSGLYKNDYRPLGLRSVSGIMHEGGTILKSSNKDNLFNLPFEQPDGSVIYKDVSDEAVKNLKYLGVDALIVIGGDGTLTSARDFSRKGIPVIGVPKTIDNDLPSTDVTFGYNTSLETITDALDKIHTTAFSHDRVMVVEVMGRNSGWLALEGGLAGSADVILIPEIPYDLTSVVEKIRQRDAFGRNFSIVVVSEGAKPKDGKQHIREIIKDSADSIRLGGIGQVITDQLQELVPEHEVRHTNLAYIQRGGVTSQFDRALGLLFGVNAVDLLMSGGSGRMVQLRGRKITSVPLEEVVGSGEVGETSRGGGKTVDPEGQYVQAAKAIGICFGDSSNLDE
ncbi:6-phosphofructokinase 1 [Candidatus Izimaplasma bacterium HR1]|uniref:6-phosphofructokinase n=1 Tax=Candidatus Izimoplasma sp. HR1 TaxID=1541959 RepID=UPI0004F7452F|nr:6-phosphofructokinase 1 [Candidatus Izimaplasma bacterium HR1]